MKFVTELMEVIIKGLLLLVILSLVLIFLLLLGIESSNMPSTLINFDYSTDVITSDRDVMYDGISVTFEDESGEEVRVPIDKLSLVGLYGETPYQVYKNALVKRKLNLFGFEFMYPLHLDYAVSSTILQESEQNYSEFLVNKYQELPELRNAINDINSELLQVYTGKENTSYYLGMFGVMVFITGACLVIAAIYFIDSIKDLMLTINEYIRYSKMDDIEHEMHEQEIKNEKSREDNYHKWNNINSVLSNCLSCDNALMQSDPYDIDEKRCMIVCGLNKKIYLNGITEDITYIHNPKCPLDKEGA